MKPILLEFGQIHIQSYAFFMILAWLTGIGIFVYEAIRRSWPQEKLLLLLGSCMIGAVLGATALEVLFLEPEIFKPKTGFWNFSGKTVLGGIAGGFLAIEFTKKRLGFTERTGDAFALAIPIGHSMGRLGCLLGGCCYGTPTSLPWGINYPQGTLPFYFYENLGLLQIGELMTPPLHPAPVYEILANMIIVAIILWRRNKTQRPGSLFRLYLILYAAFRFLIEFLRADTSVPAFMALKPVQILLLIVVAYFGWQYYNDEVKQDLKV